MKKVAYHQAFRDPQPFTVLKENENGTVDIGPVGGPAVVTNCPIVGVPEPGSCTLVKEAPITPAAKK